MSAVPYVKQHYPKMLYSAAGAVIVPNAEEHHKLGPGYYESPVDVTASPEPSSAPAAASQVALEAAENDTVASEKASLWATSVDKVVAKLEGCSAQTLEKVKAYELENPKQPRKTLIDAIDKALHAKGGGA